MLEVLRIRNFAIVENLELEFRRGLNVITGETGAGKSIVLRAVDILAGGRASADVVRTGEVRCEIEGMYRFPPEVVAQIAGALPDLVDYFSEGEGELLIRRVIDSAGKGRAYCNGRMIPVAVLAQLSAYLVDITGQHQQHSLLARSGQRELLDRFAVSGEIVVRVRKAWQAWSDALAKLKALEGASSEKADYFRRIDFERGELSAVGLEEGELENLERELDLLENSESLTEDLKHAEEIFDADEGGVDRAFASLRSALLRLPREVSGVEEVRAGAERAAVELSELRFALADLAAKAEFNPERIEEIRQRIDVLSRIKRKYGRDINELVPYLRRIESELAEYDAGGFDLDTLRAKVETLRGKYQNEADVLSQARRDGAARLGQSIAEELRQLEMKRCEFSVSFVPSAPSAHGNEEVEFLLAPNPGEAPKPLRAIASGGELSRVLLVLKALLNQESSPALQIFDEVDSGTGGSVAQAIGERLARLAGVSQVLVVTHAPQVAALGARHMVLSKRSSANRTVSEVRVVTDDDRVKEIARMLAGRKVSVNFEQSARELLEQ